jgi:predicted ATPase
MEPFVLESLAVENYRSFAVLQLELRPINVLIGGNGSGKSNLIRVFEFCQHLMDESLQLYVAQNGGPDQILHYGRKRSPHLRIHLRFRRRDLDTANEFECILIPAEHQLLIAQERIGCQFIPHYEHPYRKTVCCPEGSPASESRIPELALEKPNSIEAWVHRALRSWRIYHFHDTTPGARVKQLGLISDNLFLQSDAGNLAAFLFRLREQYPWHYRRIVETIRQVAPFFGDFVLRPYPLDSTRIALEWQERGSELLFSASSLSDGTLRFICLATLFLQPRELMPALLILDEPELGLHPAAIQLLADLVENVVVEDRQVILATQSVTLVNQFEPEDIVVVERENGRSTVRRCDYQSLEHWLQDYSLGELWEKNAIGGRPR